MALGFSAGYGFDGIVVALLARNSPVGSVAAALLFAIFRQSASLLEARLGIPSDVVLIIEGVMVVLVASSSYLVERRRAARTTGEEWPGEVPKPKQALAPGRA
jgi:simple sugar transport system permease protein